MKTVVCGRDFVLRKCNSVREGGCPVQGQTWWVKWGRREKDAEQVFCVNASACLCVSVSSYTCVRGKVGGKREVISEWPLKDETRVSVPISNWGPRRMTAQGCSARPCHGSLISVFTTNTQSHRMEVRVKVQGNGDRGMNYTGDGRQILCVASSTWAVASLLFGELAESSMKVLDSFCLVLVWHCPRGLEGNLFLLKLKDQDLFHQGDLAEKWRYFLKWSSLLRLLSRRVTIKETLLLSAPTIRLFSYDVPIDQWERGMRTHQVFGFLCCTYRDKVSDPIGWVL